nr:MAG TPA: hypothetical protein [Caudoviricetes sp.]
MGLGGVILPGSFFVFYQFGHTDNYTLETAKVLDL